MSNNWNGVPVCVCDLTSNNRGCLQSSGKWGYDYKVWIADLMILEADSIRKLGHKWEFINNKYVMVWEAEAAWEMP